MRSSLAPFALAATLLLHAALLMAVLRGWPQDAETPAEAPPLAVRLVPPAPVQAPQPVAPAAASPPSPPLEKPPSPKPASPPPKPRKAREPAVAPKVARPEPESTPASVPIAPSMPAAPAPSAPSSPAPAVAAPPTPAAPVTQPPSEARYAASNRKPSYPALSRRYGEQGTVLLRVLVQADGSAGAVEIKSSSGYPLLDDSAQTTVRSWRFTPATVDGKPVAQWYQLAIPFTLND